MLQEGKELSFIRFSKILWNVYREFYDIPKDLWVRKEDPELRLAVATSTALARAEKLRSRSITPSLVYFDNRLEEHEIKKCVQIIQGDAIDKD